MADQYDNNHPVGMGKAEIISGVAAGGVTAHIAGNKLAKAPLDTLPEEILLAGEKAAKAFRDSNAGMEATKLAEEAAKVAEAAKKPLMDKMSSLSNPFTRPLTAFKGASTPAKIAMGAAITAATIGVAIGVNKVRNIGKSHVDQLDDQREGGYQR